MNLRLKLSFALIFQVLFAQYLLAQFIPLDKYDNKLIVRLYDKNLLDYPAFFNKPLEYSKISVKNIVNADKESEFIIQYLNDRWSKISKNGVWFQSDAALTLTNFKNPRNNVRLRLDLNLYGRYFNFIFGARTRFDSDGLYDSDYRGKPVNIINGKRYYFSAFHDLAYIGYVSDITDIIFGKFRLAYGPGESGQMIISSNPPSFDLLMGKIRLLKEQKKSNSWKFQFSTAIAQLDFSMFNGNRYARTLYIQRYELNFSYLYLGLTQVELFYEKDKRNIYFNYLFPFISFFGERENNMLHSFDNLLYSVDFSIKFKSYRFYGELLVDDLSYDFSLPQKIGFLLGVKIPNFMMDNLGISIEYVRINRFTYAYNLGDSFYDSESGKIAEVMLRYVFYGRANDFTHGSIIGHWLGSDADLLQLDVWKYISAGLFINLKFSYIRHGEGNIYEPITPPSPKPKAFLYGIVERSIGLNMEITYISNLSLKFRLSLGLTTFKNKGNIAGNNENLFKISLVTNYDPFIKLF